MIGLKLFLGVWLSFLLPGCNFAQIDYTVYNNLLSRNVNASGNVDYSSIIKNDKDALNRFLKHMAVVEPEKLEDSEQLAFWINVYNASTIKLIIDHWPVKSIQDIDNGKPWDRKWIKLNDGTYSLNQIENEIIRPRFHEPRIHFAVNCAAESCPPLLNEAFTGNRLEEQLDQRTQNFINNTTYNQLSKSSIKVSKIFDWYKSDFENVINFVNKYAKTNINTNATIRYIPYDWALNN